MKAILEFNFPEDEDAHYVAVNGGNLYRALWTIMMDVFRRECKYGVHPPEVQEVIDRMQKEAWDIVDGLLED